MILLSFFAIPLVFAFESDTETDANSDDSGDENLSSDPGIQPDDGGIEGEVDEIADDEITFRFDTFTATEGDDTVTVEALLGAEGFDGEYVSVGSGLNLLSGDDVFDTNLSAYEFELNAGDGDDTVSMNRIEGVANGDAGNDVMSGGLGVALNGGDGDDTLSFETNDGHGDYRGSAAHGGAGDDAILVSHELGWRNTFDTATTLVSGGPGADLFVMELTDGTVTELDEFEGYVQRTELEEVQVYVQDFTSGEDTLEIDISDFTENGVFELVSASLEPLADHWSTPAGSNGFELMLDLLAEGEVEPFQVRVVISTPGVALALSDIGIETGLAA